VNVTFHDCGSGIDFVSDVVGVEKKPLPCVLPS
jgi:hypothetical protein